MSKVYKLILDIYRESDTVYDAVLRTFEGSDKLRYYFLDPNTYSTDLIPEKLYFDANFKMLTRYDFPFTDSGIFIVSSKVKSVIDQFIDFEFHETQIIMFDDTVLEDRFYINGEINRLVPTNSDFIALRFPELKSYFDFENSIYRVSQHNQNSVRGIKKMVLNESTGKFPAIFSTRESATTILVREDLKLAFENSLFWGVTFEEVETIK